jgi:hypothetical protein
MSAGIGLVLTRQDFTAVFTMSTASVTTGYMNMAGAAEITYPIVSKPIMALVGGFGSGKTEVSVNLAKFLAFEKTVPVSIADFDLVNPYFRTREAVAEMEAMGIRVIVPRGGQFYADLPILMPEIKGAIENNNGRLILDVGGDSQGTRALGSLSAVFVPGQYDMWMVLNSRRPQTSDVAGCVKTMQRIENTARLKFTGLISNSHMIDETDADVITEGYRLAREVERETGLPLVFVSAKKSVLEKIDTTVFECPILPLTRSMLKPWERKEKPAGDQTDHQRT